MTLSIPVEVNTLIGGSISSRVEVVREVEVVKEVIVEREVEVIVEVPV